VSAASPSGLGERLRPKAFDNQKRRHNLSFISP
jgi:hypothetical protein